MSPLLSFRVASTIAITHEGVRHGSQLPIWEILQLTTQGEDTGSSQRDWATSLAPHPPIPTKPFLLNKLGVVISLGVERQKRGNEV